MLFKGQFFFYLECAKIFINIVFGGSLVAKSCPTLAIPVVCSPPGSYVLGILQARILEWVVIFFSTQDLFHPGIEPQSTALQADSLLTELRGNPKYIVRPTPRCLPESIFRVIQRCLS